MKMNDHERAIRNTLLRCKTAIGKHDEQAYWGVSCDITTAGTRGLSYGILCESKVLAIAPRKTESIGGVGSTLEEAERLFITSVAMMVERKARQVERIRLRTRKRPLRDSEIPY